MNRVLTQSAYDAPTKKHAQAMAVGTARNAGVRIQDVFYEKRPAGHWHAMAYNDDYRHAITLCCDGAWRW
jgi:hypothetical protein